VVVVVVVAAAAAAAAAAVVVVVRSGMLAFGCTGAHTSSTFNAQHQRQALGAARVY